MCRYADPHRETQHNHITGQQKATREGGWNLFPLLQISPPSRFTWDTLFFGDHLEDIELIERCQPVQIRFPQHLDSVEYLLFLSVL